MKTIELMTMFDAQQRARERLLTRERFLYRCIDDIENDFHKQFGPFQQDWIATLDACDLFLEQLQQYVCTRDLLMYECQLLFGSIETAETKYQVAKSKRRCEELLILSKVHDIDTLKEFDEHITSVRAVYKMIAVQEEY